MSHFELADWADLVRGTVSDAAWREALEAHLEGCDRCRTAVERFRRVAEDAGLEAGPEPPAGAMRTVQAIFRLERMRRRPEHFRLPLEVAYDSRLAAPAADTRGATGRRLALICRSGPYALDVMAERDSVGHRTVLSGQLAGGGNRPLPGVAAFLVSGRRVLSSDLTGPLGEFELSSPAGDELRLFLVVESEKLIELALDEAVPGA